VERASEISDGFRGMIPTSIEAVKAKQSPRKTCGWVSKGRAGCRELVGKKEMMV